MHGKRVVVLAPIFFEAENRVEVLKQLKAGGYKVVFMKPKDSLKTLAEYDELVKKDIKLPTVSTRPTSSVVRTIGGDSN